MRVERAKAGKKTGVLGQIMLAAMIAKGGDEKGIRDAFGGQFPAHIRPDVGLREGPLNPYPRTPVLSAGTHLSRLIEVSPKRIN